MEIFKIQILPEGLQINDECFLELLFCEQKRQLSDYWLMEYGDSLSVTLIAFMKEWKKALKSLEESKKVFLSIGLWDECVEGFYIMQLDEDNIKVQYGSILNWSGFTQKACEYDIDENIFYKECEIEINKNVFLQDIIDNITYLEKEIRNAKK